MNYTSKEQSLYEKQKKGEISYNRELGKEPVACYNKPKKSIKEGKSSDTDKPMVVSSS
jgi:hypothetical protein